MNVSDPRYHILHMMTDDSHTVRRGHHGHLIAELRLELE